MEFRSAIVDELGHFISWCDDLSEETVDEYLEMHPECRRICLEV